MRTLALWTATVVCLTPLEAASPLESAAQFLPAEANALFGVDVLSAKESSLYAKFQQHMKSDDRERLDEMATSTGFDPRTDLDSVVVASWGGPQGMDSMLAVATGRFDLTPQAEWFLDEVGQVDTHGGLPIYEQLEQDGPRKMQFTFLDGSTGLAGTPEALRAGIDRRTSAGPVIDAGFLERATDAERDGQLWMVSRGGSPMLAGAQRSPGARDPRIGRILSGVTETKLTANILDGLNLTLAGTCASADDASTLAAAVRGMMAFARLGAEAEGGGMFGLLDQITVWERDNAVEAQLDLSAIELENWISILEREMPGVAD